MIGQLAGSWEILTKPIGSVDALDSSVWCQTENIRIPSIRHCSVEIVVEMNPQLDQIRMNWRLVIEQDEVLMRMSPARGRQVARIQITGVEENGMAVIE